MIHRLEVENHNLKTMLKALGNDALWSYNADGELYTIVPNAGLRYINEFAFDHSDLIEVTPYPKDEKAKQFLKGESLHGKDRYKRITLKVNVQDFQPKKENIADREEGVRARHIAFCNAEIHVQNKQPYPVRMIGEGNETIMVPPEKILFLQVISPLLTAREIYRCFPKEVRSLDKDNGGAYWKMPELTLLTGDKARNVKNRKELVPLRASNAGNDKDMDLFVPVELLPAFLPVPAVAYLKRRYDLNISSEPQQLGLEGIAPGNNPWLERVRGPNPKGHLHNPNMR